jgi:hypothetical protein
MQLSKGTVSVIDDKAICFSRIWCVYELFQSLTNEAARNKVYDMYTAVDHTAVGLVDGLAAVDADSEDKCLREQHFPLVLLDKGIEFKCKDGEASFPADQKRISDAIGKDATLLDEKVHGVVAAAALKGVLVADDIERRSKYLEAVRAGHVRKLHLDLCDSTADTEVVVAEVLAALDADYMEELQLRSEALKNAESVCNLTALHTLDLANCSGLTSLPESMKNLTALHTLHLDRCERLTSLPDLSGLPNLEKVNISFESEAVKGWKDGGYKAFSK